VILVVIKKEVWVDEDSIRSSFLSFPAVLLNQSPSFFSLLCGKRSDLRLGRLLSLLAVVILLFPGPLPGSVYVSSQFRGEGGIMPAFQGFDSLQGEGFFPGLFLWLPDTSQAPAAQVRAPGPGQAVDYQHWWDPIFIDADKN